MADVLLYHPDLDADPDTMVCTMMAPESTVPIWRTAGWVIKSEWDEQQAQAAARRAEREAQAAAAQAEKAPAKSRAGGKET
jgi:hypothetical protein